MCQPALERAKRAIALAELECPEPALAIVDTLDAATRLATTLADDRRPLWLGLTPLVYVNHSR